MKIKEYIDYLINRIDLSKSNDDIKNQLNNIYNILEHKNISRKKIKLIIDELIMINIITKLNKLKKKLLNE